MKEKILSIYSSPNKEGNSATLANWILEEINNDKYDIEKVHLYETELKYMTNEYYNFADQEKIQDEGAQIIFPKVQEANKIIISFPVWNFGVPAVLKNFLDRATISGRKWSKEKNKKVANWKDKTFFIVLSTGAPKMAIILNSIAIIQLILTLKYYGAKSKVIAVAYSCKNGSENIVKEREKLRNKIIRKSRKYFS